MKRVLLDTNIVIHREANTIVRQDIGVLFKWLERLHFEKCIHPLTIREIQKHKDPKVVASFSAKLGNYVELKTEAPETPQIEAIRLNDKDENSRNDTSVVKELFARRVDMLITEDRGIHTKAKLLGIEDRIFTIDAFLEKVVAENPSLVDYRVLAVRQEFFGNMTVGDIFFDSFRRDYPGFDDWFNRKSDESAYVCSSDSGEIQAFLYLKMEGTQEVYSDIVPVFSRKKRLKIGTFKVTLNGHKLGERFLKIVFDNALAAQVEEIYVTIFDKDTEQQRLIALLEEWGFVRHGFKQGKTGAEIVLVRDFSPKVDPLHPTATFPFMSGERRKFIVPIYPDYHTELLPDSILRNEDPGNFEGNRPNRNALRKVYISRSIERSMKPGDLVVFYRTGQNGSAYYTAVATTLGVIEKVTDKISSLQQFISLCRKRSVFTDEKLAEFWNYNPNYRPFVVNFIHTHSFPKRPNRKALLDAGVIPQEPPRGFLPISDSQFRTLLQLAHADQSLVIY